MALSTERFRARHDEIFGAWKERFAACLQEAQRTGELSKVVSLAVMAGFILSGWEAAILRAELMKSPEPVAGFHRYPFYHGAEEATIFFTAKLDDRSITNI